MRKLNKIILLGGLLFFLAGQGIVFCEQSPNDFSNSALCDPNVGYPLRWYYDPDRIGCDCTTDQNLATTTRPYLPGRGGVSSGSTYCYVTDSSKIGKVRKCTIDADAGYPVDPNPECRTSLLAFDNCCDRDRCNECVDDSRCDFLASFSPGGVDDYSLIQCAQGYYGRKTKQCLFCKKMKAEGDAGPYPSGPYKIAFFHIGLSPGAGPQRITQQLIKGLITIEPFGYLYRNNAFSFYLVDPSVYAGFEISDPPLPNQFIGGLDFEKYEVGDPCFGSVYTSFNYTPRTLKDILDFMKITCAADYNVIIDYTWYSGTRSNNGVGGWGSRNLRFIIIGVKDAVHSQILAHELGHVLGDLDDEVYFSDDGSGPRHSAKNLDILSPGPMCSEFDKNMDRANCYEMKMKCADGSTGTDYYAKSTSTSAMGYSNVDRRFNVASCAQILEKTCSGTFEDNLRFCCKEFVPKDQVIEGWQCKRYLGK